MNKHMQNATFKNANASVDFHWFNGSSNLHSHDYYELFVIFNGDFSHEYNGKTISLVKGDAVLIVPNKPHLLLANSKYGVHANFSFTNEAFKTLTCDYGAELADSLIKTTGQPFKISDEKLSFLENFINSLLLDSKMSDYCYLSIIHLLFAYFSIINDKK